MHFILARFKIDEHRLPKSDKWYCPNLKIDKFMVEIYRAKVLTRVAVFDKYLRNSDFGSPCDIMSEYHVTQVHNLKHYVTLFIIIPDVSFPYLHHLTICPMQQHNVTLVSVKK